MFNFFKMAFAVAIAAAVGYFLYQLLAFAVDYVMAFVGIATGIFLLVQWALIGLLQIFIPLYIAGLIFAWLYNWLVK